MSYILDALRRADAERHRGAVPGLHAQPMAGVLNDAAPAPGAPARRLGVAAAALLLLGLAVAAAWLLRPAAGPQTAGATVAVMPAPALPSAPLVAAPPAPAPAPPAPARPTPPSAPTPAQARLPPGQPALAPALPAGRRPALPPSSASTDVGLATAPAPALPAAMPMPARLPSLAELPEAQKRELGPLLVGGAMHAEQAALRIVILNGQVFHEGDKLGPDLQVQQIRLKSVVMSHRGQRFELPF